MPMTSFSWFVGERAWAETRTVILRRHVGALRAGEYTFLELYCTEADCDCRRVFLQVVRAADPSPLATIGFGWEAPAFYRAWAHGDDDADVLAGSQLVPMAPQGALAPDLLALFRARLESDPAYVARLERHYREARLEVERRHGHGATGSSRAATTSGASASPSRSTRDLRKAPAGRARPGSRKLGSDARPACARVRTRERAEALLETCNEHGWKLIVGIEPDEPEDVADVERLLRREAGLRTPPATRRTPSRNSPCPCGSRKRFKRCCGTKPRRERGPSPP